MSPQDYQQSGERMFYTAANVSVHSYVFLAQFMLKQVHTYLSSHQKFYVAGAFAEQLANTSWFVEGNNSPQPDPAYSCNAEENRYHAMVTCQEDKLQQDISLVPRYRRLYDWLTPTMYTR